MVGFVVDDQEILFSSQILQNPIAKGALTLRAPLDDPSPP